MLLLAALHDLADRRLRRLRRIHYQFRGDVDTTTGPIELTFDDGSVLLLDAGPDGESLGVGHEAWLDPFRPPLSAENRDYVDRFGKWTAFDVTDESPYATLIGQRVVAVDVRPSRRPDVAIGVVLRLQTAAIVVKVEGDELSVSLL